MVISVCLFVCPIITQEPLNRFVSNFDRGNWETHANVLSLVLRFLVEWIDFNKERVNYRSNYEYPGFPSQYWSVPNKIISNSPDRHIYVHYQQIGYFISRYRQNVNLISIKRGGGGKLSFKRTVSVNLSASLSKNDCPQRYPGNLNLIKTWKII